MGYGSRALELLSAFYQGDFTSLKEDVGEEVTEDIVRVDDDELKVC